MINISSSLERQMVFYMGIGLIIFLLVASSITYMLAFRERTANTNKLLEQLAQTVKIQAEIALFTNNDAIADGVINSLLINPIIIGVKIKGVDNYFRSSSNIKHNNFFTNEIKISLFAPDNDHELIGSLSVIHNEDLTKQEARKYALILSLWLFLQIVLSALLLILIMRYLISKPVHLLAETFEKIKPGEFIQLKFQKHHEHDEIGKLTASANKLLRVVSSAIEEIREMAITDVLTELPNRRYFMEQLQLEFKRIKRFNDFDSCVLMLDMDHFKRVNDTYGHDGGDACLIHLSLLIKKELRQPDTAGRIGGEEFAIILPNTNPDEADIFANRLRIKLAEKPVIHGEQKINLTLSIGIATIKRSDINNDECLKRADQALYRAKTNGRNRVEIN